MKCPGDKCKQQPPVIMGGQLLAYAGEGSGEADGWLPAGRSLGCNDTNQRSESATAPIFRNSAFEQEGCRRSPSGDVAPNSRRPPHLPARRAAAAVALRDR